MRQNLIVVVSLLLAAAPAAARPGFYVGFGLGGSSVHGSVVQPLHMTSTIAPTVPPPTFDTTTDFEGGLSLQFAMGFNILGYAAVETRLTGQGHSLDDANLREWAAHWHTGVRAYPMWHWQDRLPQYLQPLEPSLFVGWGTTYQGYSPPQWGDEVAWRTWNSWRFGAGVEYFFVEYFKVALDYSFVAASHDMFIRDFSDSDNFKLDPKAPTGFHQFYVIGIFQFEAGK